MLSNIDTHDALVLTYTTYAWLLPTFFGTPFTPSFHLLSALNVCSGLFVLCKP